MENLVTLSHQGNLIRESDLTLLILPNTILPIRKNNGNPVKLAFPLVSKAIFCAELRPLLKLLSLRREIYNREEDSNNPVYNLLLLSRKGTISNLIIVSFIMQKKKAGVKKLIRYFGAFYAKKGKDHSVSVVGMEKAKKASPSST